MIRTKSKKASQQQWLEIWMEKGSKFEHEAFLCLWLSRYLPAEDCSTMNKSVFQIAVNLARDTKFGLAPAILASIYRDLRLLKEKITTLRDLGDQNDVNVLKLALWAPLYLLQVWIWERFPALSPRINHISNGLCRIKKWHKTKILRNDDEGLPINFASHDFRWRPYSNTSFNHDLESYCRFIRVCDLVGLYCIEQYLPHRVARQFGFDQDILIAFRHVRDTPKIGWMNYIRPVSDTKLYRPPRQFEPGVTIDYMKWWEKKEFGNENVDGFKEIRNPNAKQFEGTSKVSLTAPFWIRIKMENNEADVPPGFSPKLKNVALDGSFNEHESSPKGFGQGQDSAVSSKGDNAFIQETKSTTNSAYISPNEEERMGNEDGIESNAESPVRNQDSIHNNEIKPGLEGDSESSSIDLLGRIARLQRIIDMMKADKFCHAYGQMKASLINSFKYFQLICFLLS